LIRRIILRLAISAILVLALAVPAFAQGKVEQGTEHANSICSYSGLNDHDTEEPPGGRVQNYGHEKKSDPDAASPGLLCNGHKFPYPEAFPPPAP
jgi:hypothetical protein